MSIKAKLLSIALFLFLSAGFAASYLLYCSLKADEQLTAADGAVEDLHGFAVLRLDLHRTMSALTGYAFTGEERDREEYERHRRLLEGAEKTGGGAWQKAKPQALLELFHKIRTLREKGAGDVLDVLRREAVPQVEEEMNELDLAKELEAQSVRDAYDLLLVRLGSVPWISGGFPGEVKRSRESMEDFLSAERACTMLNRQMQAGLVYVLSGMTDDRQRYTRCAMVVRAALDHWIARTEQRTGQGASVDLQNALSVRRKHEEVSVLTEEAFRLHGEGRREEAYALLHGKVRPVVDGYLVPKIAKAYDEFRMEAYQAHQSLRRVSRNGRIIGVSALALFGILLILGTGWLLRGMLQSLSALSGGTTALTRGDLSHRIGLSGGDELAVLARAFDRMAGELERTTVTRDRLRSLASDLTLVEEAERRKIASALHDGVGQTLAFLKMRLKTLQSEVQDEEQRGILRDLAEKLETSIQQTRTLTFDLSPPVLYELGFLPAVEWLAERIRKEHDLDLHLDLDEGLPPLSNDLRVFLFQALRETLTNVIKHAGARKAWIRMQGREGGIRIEVEDDGKGPAADDPRTWREEHGWGLFSIRERLDHLGGDLTLSERPEGGTRVVLDAPTEFEEKGGEA